MAVLDLDLNPDRKTLRNFGIASWVVFWALAWVGSAFWSFPAEVAAALGVLGTICAVFALRYPRGNKPLYLLLNVVFYPIGIVVSYVVLGVLFYGILTPVSLVFRLIGRDALRRSMNEEAASYWIPHASPKDARRYFRPF